MQNLTTSLKVGEILRSRQAIVFWLVVLAYITVNLILLCRGIYVLLVLPLLLVVLYILIFRTSQIIFLVTLLTPLSINYLFEKQGISISMPTEPIMVLVMVLFLLRILISSDYDRNVMKHPITIAILANLLWLLITSFSSTMPLVSFKFFFARSWFLILFYFMIMDLFKDIKNIRKFIWLYMGALVLIVIYALFNHSHFYFTHKEANLVSRPFYRDHTIYGAVLALFIPLIYGFIFKSKLFGIKRMALLVTVFAGVILTLGTIFSYTRAAWLSLAVASGFLVLLLFRLRFRTILGMSVLITLLVLVFWTKIIMSFDQNKSISSTDFKDHIQSISNITTDASNSERINRWDCAIRMFREKPFLGWGPGTYMFNYAPFQMSYERTVISTNRGDLGNAHSEYLGPLAESGVLGMLSFLAIAFIIIYKGIQLYYNGKTQEIRILSLLLLLSLVTYLAHGIMNNFLDSDKAAVPFWGFVAALTSLDIYHNRAGKLKSEK